MIRFGNVSMKTRGRITIKPASTTTSGFVSETALRSLSIKSLFDVSLLFATTLDEMPSDVAHFAPMDSGLFVMTDVIL